MIPILLQTLASQGLSLLANAVMAKGKDVIEEKLGVSLDTTPPHELLRLQQEHEEFLLEVSIRHKELELQAEAAAQSSVTERWKADMISDSYLSKNIRPLVLAFWTVAIVFLMLVPVDIDPAWIELVKISYTTILAAYFIGRTYEKHVDMKERGKVG